MPENFTLDDASNFGGNSVSTLHQMLRNERDPMARLPLMQQILTARAQVNEQGEVAAPRKRMADLYAFDENRKPAQRKRENAAAMALLAQIDSGDINPASLTAEQKAVLAKYSGTGGALIGADGKKGSAYEYYTPAPVAQGIWDALAEMGFAGGKVLDPCGGTGIFGATAPESAVVDAVELNETSGRVQQLVNDGPGYKTTISPFEAVASKTPDETYDAVVTNVPFGGVADRGANRLLDKRYQDEPLQNYFILRSLEKLRGGGIAAFITPPRCVSGKDGAEAKMRLQASMMAEFIGAYRLPNKVFGTAAADTMTDVMFFRKYDKETREKIQELREQSPEVLTEANVLFTEFLEGKYFQGEGRRFVLGEMTKGKGQWGEVDVLTTNATVGEIGKMLRKLPDSRINWELLGATETDPITYKDGDTIYQAGQCLQMQDGQWIPVDDSHTEMAQSTGVALQNMATPYAAWEARVSYAQAKAFAEGMANTGQALDIPGWLRDVMTQTAKWAAADQTMYWTAGLVGMSVQQVVEERAGDDGVNFLEEYAALSDAMQVQYATAKGAPGKITGRIKLGLKAITTYYSKKNGFSAFWRGDVQLQVQNEHALTAQGTFEGLRYKLKSAWVPMEDAKAIYGEDFDPYTDDAWCVSADGSKVTKADDYYVGNYADFLRKIDAEIASATSEALKAKLLRQKTMAAERIERVDVSKLEFNLFSPHVTAEEKVEFLSKFVSPFAVVAYDDGKARPDIQIKTNKDSSDRDKLLNRIGDYLKNGTITLGGAKLDMDDAQALAELRKMVRTANEQFNGWARSNPTIQARLQAQADDPAKLRFERVEDTEPLEIPGMNPALKLHGYQNAFVRAQSREFGGGNGFDVGLGKAQPMNSKILTPSGWKRMGDMQVGDTVISVDGKPTRVNGVYPQGKKEIFEVTFSDGSITRCCDEHLWLTKTESDRKIERYNRRLGRDVVKAGTVKSLAEIRESLTYQTQKNHQIPLVGAIEFQEKNLPIRPYLMGVLLGDGGFTHKAVTFTTVDEEIASRVSHLLKDGFDSSVALRKRVCKNRAQSYGISKADEAQKNAVREELERFNLAGKSSAHKFIPDAYLWGSADQRIELLRGLMDTDGYVSKDGITVQFSSSSRLLAEGVRQLVQSLGGIAWIKSKIAAFKVAGARKQGLEVFTVSMRMPPEINPFNLQRKAKLVKPKSKYLPVRYFVSVRSVGFEEAQCISVEHPSHLYVTDDYIVTHNTFTALAATQYVQSIGVKKKTVFVVPGSVLSNWRKEATNAYTSIEDCLFVGLRDKKGGGYAVKPEFYDEDLNRIRENRHSKIFMTMEAFERLRLKDETISKFGDHMRQVDMSFAEVQDKKKDERNKGKAADFISVLSDKSGGAPYLEDLGIDSLVSDESHAYKNSSEVSEFKGGKYLSLSPASKRGIDMQAKAWYIRGASEAGDGVLLLTASPITNSPLEIYSMLALAVGHQRVNDLCLGVKGADQFMQMMCQVDSETDVTMDGITRETNVFTGLNNVAALRKAVNSVFTIKNAEQVGAQIVVPDAEESKTPVALPSETKDRLKLYKEAFRYAIDVISEKPDPRGSEEAFEAVQAHFGEPMELIGHPFNLINKMTMLIADPELDQRSTFYSFSPAKAQLAMAVVEKFNAKKVTEDRARPGPITEEGSIVTRKVTKDQETGDEKVAFKIHVKAYIVEGSRVQIDTIDPDTQSAFEAIAEAQGLDLDVTIPPKLAAMLENFKNEQAHPRGVIDGTGERSKLVKQIVFCDILPLHNKIKRILTKHAGVPAGAIAIITGQTNNKPEQILEVQDGFNAQGDENKYRTVIANEKAEVGINLQKGTQAIHHLTIGWTPDSLQQRNGRGVRQGNHTAKVTVYHYDADGTFDCAKRVMVGKKADWISQVMDASGSNKVAISGGMSAEQLRMLIDTVGDADAMRRVQETMAAKEAEARASNNRERQLINLDTIKKQREYLDSNPDATKSVIRKVLGLHNLRQQVGSLQDKIAKSERPTAIAKYEGLLAEVQARIEGLVRIVDESATITRGGPDAEPMGVLAFLENNGRSGRNGGFTKDDDLSDMLQGRKYPSHQVKVIEGSPIHREWELEVGLAQRMLDDAIKTFESQAEESGALPAPIARKIAEGHGFIYGGQPFVTGTFLRIPQNHGAQALAVYEHGTGYNGNQIKAARDTMVMTRSLMLINIKNATIIQPGSSDYPACLQEAAAIEDKASELGKPTTIYSEVVPAVASLRKTAATRSYRIYSAQLPSPYFPVVIEEEAAKRPGASVLARIYESQKAIVQSTNGREFIAEVSAGVIEGAKSVDRVQALLDYAKANGMKLSRADLQDDNVSGIEYGRWAASAAELAGKPLSDVLSRDFDSERAIDAAIVEWLGELLPQVDWAEHLGGERASMIAQLVIFAATSGSTLYAAAKRKLTGEAAPASEGDPNDIVAVTGNTMAWKDRIKMVAGKYKWDGRATAWNIYRSAWNELVKRYPDAGKELQIGKGTVYRL